MAPKTCRRCGGENLPDHPCMRSNATQFEERAATISGERRVKPSSLSPKLLERLRKLGYDTREETITLRTTAPAPQAPHVDHRPYYGLCCTCRERPAHPALGVCVRCWRPQL